MKRAVFNIIFYVGIVLISSGIFAQNQQLSEEEDLKFQTCFFEALKQKAINNFTKAVENLELCLQLNPENTAVEFELSKNYLQLKRYNEAEIFIEKALLKKPESTYMLAHQMKVYAAQHKLLEAIETAKKLSEIKPIYNEDLIRLYLQNQNNKEAEAVILKMEKNALSNEKIRYFKKYLENKYMETELEAAPKEAANDNVDLETLKNKFLETKDYKTLQEILKLANEKGLYEVLYSESSLGLEFFPAQPFLYKMNGLALIKLGKFKQAIDILTIGIDFVIDNPHVEAAFYDLLSLGFEGLNNQAESLKCKQKADKLRRGN